MLSAAGIRSLAPSITLAALMVADGDGLCDGFLAEIGLRDINDPDIVIARPS